VLGLCWVLMGSDGGGRVRGHVGREGVRRVIRVIRVRCVVWVSGLGRVLGLVV